MRGYDTFCTKRNFIPNILIKIFQKFFITYPSCIHLRRYIYLCEIKLFNSYLFEIFFIKVIAYICNGFLLSEDTCLN